MSILLRCRSCLPLLVLAAASTAAAGRPGSNPIADAFPLVFDSERIRLEIVGDSLEVRGTYILLCRAPVVHSIPLFYPFPKDSLLGGARMVALSFRQDGDSAAPARWEEPPGAWGVRWWVPPCTGDSIVAEAVYRQKLEGAYARYIVTTTRIWGRRLRRARFEIRLPEGAEPVEFSFPFEPWKGPGGTRYVYEAQEFFPDRDIVVRWRR